MNRDVLQKSKLFGGLNKDNTEYALCFLNAAEKEYSKGEFMHQAGHRLLHFGLVMSGTVQVCMDDINGNNMIMANATAGETFGESLCFLSMDDIPIYIRAVTDVRVLWMETSSIFACLQGCDTRKHDLIIRFISMLAERTLAMNDRIQILSKLCLRDKLVTFFSQYMYKSGSRVFVVPFDRSDMSVYLGTNRSSLSRELSKMRKEGIIKFHKNHFHLLKKF